MEESLGFPIAEYKKVINDEINRFLMGQVTHHLRPPSLAADAVWVQQPPPGEEPQQTGPTAVSHPPVPGLEHCWLQPVIETTAPGSVPSVPAVDAAPVTDIETHPPKAANVQTSRDSAPKHSTQFIGGSETLQPKKRRKKQAAKAEEVIIVPPVSDESEEEAEEEVL